MAPSTTDDEDHDPRPWCLVTDFDGTAARVDVGDAIVLRFASSLRSRLDFLNEQAAAGEIAVAELQERIWPDVRLDPAALEDFLDCVVKPREGFVELVDALLGSGGTLVIASGGFDLYIRHALDRWFDRPPAVRVYANELRVVEGRARVRFPHRETLGCARCAVCKGAVLDRLRAEGRRVAFCGDGVSDGCSLGRADRLFCVEGSRLHRFAEAKGAAFETFSSFVEVGAALGIGPSPRGAAHP